MVERSIKKSWSLPTLRTVSAAAEARFELEEQYDIANLKVLSVAESVETALPQPTRLSP